MSKRALCVLAFVVAGLPAHSFELGDAVQQDYDEYLWPLFDHFHRNPELSLIENETAARMASELRAAGFEVTENVGGTGVVAVLRNGDGPRVMMRADMDGLPVEEKSGLENASRKKQADPITAGTYSFTCRRLSPSPSGVASTTGNTNPNRSRRWPVEASTTPGERSWEDPAPSTE